MYLNILFLSFFIAITVSTEDAPAEALKYVRPNIDDTLTHFAEPFHNEAEFKLRWIKSETKKDDVEEAVSKYDGIWEIKEANENSLEGDNGLVLASAAKHAAVSAKLNRPFKFEERPFIVQYEVRFQNVHECGGSYVKLLTDLPELDLKQFRDKTPYTIMFGPDKCGGDSKLHFIFQHQNPLTNKMEEKHAKKGEGDFSKIFDDKKTHLVTLIVRPDNTFEVFVDRVKVNSGSLLSDMEPAVNPPREIDDLSDSKPDDWDEREKIVDPTATKPDDWDEDAPKEIVDPSATKPSDWKDDEPELIGDPQAERPEDWDDEEDGEWEPPQIANPACKAAGCGEWKPPMIKNPDFKGKWTAPLISNPDYKGKWAPRKIENPEFFEDLNPFNMLPISAVGFELWSMQSDILFDNIIITDDEANLQLWTEQTWQLKHDNEVASEPSSLGKLWNSFKEATDEKPWLWAVAFVAILLPVVLIYIFCLSGGSKQDNKKTDEPQPDDESDLEDKETETKDEDKTEEKVEDEDKTEEKVEDEENQPEGENEEASIETEGDSLDKQDNEGEFVEEEEEEVRKPRRRNRKE